MAEVSSDPWDKFPAEHKEAVLGLIWLGNLQKEVKFCGHSFVLRTLKPMEKAEIAKVIAPWQDTLAARDVYNNAHVGMALVSIDGDSAFLPPAGPNLEEFVRVRLRYVTGEQDANNGGRTGWNQLTLEYLFSEWVKLEKESFGAIGALRDFYEKGRTLSTTSADNLTDRDFSNEETSGDIPIST
jgi:hypothetical protein